MGLKKIAPWWQRLDSRRRAFVIAGSGIVIAGLGVALLSEPCPVQLKLVSMEDVGTDLTWVTLSITNKRRLPLCFSATGTKAHARVTNGWLAGQDVFMPTVLVNGAEVSFLVPKDATACRLNLDFRYRHETLKEVLGIGQPIPPSKAAEGIQRFVKRLSPGLFNGIWRTRPSSRPYWYSWSKTALTPEIKLGIMSQEKPL